MEREGKGKKFNDTYLVSLLAFFSRDSVFGIGWGVRSIGCICWPKYSFIPCMLYIELNESISQRPSKRRFSRYPL